MADDPNPALRAELVAAIEVLAPQIRGLHDLALVSITADLAAEISKEIVVRERRRDLINAVIAMLDSAWQALNALEADGYPSLPTAPIPAALFSELHGDEADIEAAVSLFTQQAVSVGLDVPNATIGQQPVP